MSQPKMKPGGRVPEVNPSPRRSSIEGADLLLLLTTLLWGINYPVVKYALSDLLPLNFLALRFFLGTLIMLGFTLLTGRNLWVPRGDFLRLCALGFFANVLYQSLFAYGLKLSSAGDASIMLATAPIFTAIIGRLRRLEFFSVSAVIGLLLAFLGIALLVSYGGPGQRAGNKVLGNCILLVASACWATYTIGIKWFSHLYGSIKATTLVMTTGMPMLVLVSAPALVSQNWRGVRAASWDGVVYSAVFAIAISYIIWGYGVHKIGPTRTALYSNITPIATLLVAWPMLGEAPLPGQIFGAIVILVGVYLVRQGMTYAPATGEPIEQEIEETIPPG
jgi:drug/metabolite transporter (DMT)-like permease